MRAHVIARPVAAVFALSLSLLACVAPTESDDDAGSGASGTSSSGAGGAGSGVGTGSGAGTSTGTGGDDTPGNTPFVAPELQHRVVLGHYLGNYDLVDLSTENLSGGSTEPGAPTSGILGIAKHDVVAVALEGGETIQVYDASTMTEISGSPYDTGYGPVDLAHDDARDLLYVYCIGTAGDPSKSLLTVYDTSTQPFVEVAGSPFDIDVAGLQIDVDPITGHVFGASLHSYWAVSVTDTVTHLPGSPGQISEGVGGPLAVDYERRRLYVGERRYGGEQQIYAFDLDTLAPHQRSPVTVPGSALGEIALDPTDGDLFVVDYGTATLHSLSADPLAVRDTCGTNGCPIPTTETGLALDHELGRLFIVHVPDLNEPDAAPGFLTAWDVSDPAMPTEITAPGERPTLGIYPITATVF